MQFYSHLTNIQELIVELDSLDLSPKEKRELAGFLDSNLHHTILDAVFSELSEEDKQIFIHHLEEGEKEKVWEFLNIKVDSIEEKIKKAAEDLKVELRKELKEAKTIQRKHKEGKSK